MWSQKLCFGKKWATLKPYPCPWPAPWLSSKRGTNITLQFGPRINISGWDSLASLSPLPWRDSPSPIKLIVFTVLILLMCHTFFSRFFSFLVTIEFSDKMNAFHYLDSSRSKLKRTQWLKITQNVAFESLDFGIFTIFKTELPGNYVWPQASGFQKLAKVPFLAILMNFWNVNVARFARNDEWDFFYDFQPPWEDTNCCTSGAQ